jgi:hypothetical protein
VSPEQIKFRLVNGVKRTASRAVGFLVGDDRLDASAEFGKLKESRKRFILDSMDAWVNGTPDISTRFHGWPNDGECWMCYVFKAREGNVGHRFYGYLCNPLPDAKGFRVCALCTHARKTERTSDRTELLFVKGWSQSREALAAIRDGLREETGAEAETG